MADEGVGASRLENDSYVETSPPAGPAQPPLSSESINDKLMTVVQSGPLQELIGRMLDGSEPMARPLAYWENSKFNATNLSVVLLRVAGFSQKEIAEMTMQSPAWISTTLKHPYARQLIQTLVPMVAVQSLDIRRRQEHYGSVLLDKVFDMAIESNDINEVRQVTFGLLDRAGFGEHKVSKVEHSFSAPSETMERLSKALEASAKLDSIMDADYTILSREEITAEEGSSASLVSDDDARSLNEPPIGASPSENSAERAA